MTQALTLWLAFVLAAGTIAFFGTKRQAIAFAIVAILTAPATLLPLGQPSPLSPPKDGTVLGSKIDIGRAIYVLLDGPTPRYYVLPYSEQTAKALQDAQSAAEGSGGSVVMRAGEDGSPGFAEDAPPPEPVKGAERAVVGG